MQSGITKKRLAEGAKLICTYKDRFPFLDCNLGILAPIWISTPKIFLAEHEKKTKSIVKIGHSVAEETIKKTNEPFSNNIHVQLYYKLEQSNSSCIFVCYFPSKNFFETTIFNSDVGVFLPSWTCQLRAEFKSEYSLESCFLPVEKILRKEKIQFSSRNFFPSPETPRDAQNSSLRSRSCPS